MFNKMLEDYKNDLESQYARLMGFCSGSQEVRVFAEIMADSDNPLHKHVQVLVYDIFGEVLEPGDSDFFENLANVIEYRIINGGFWFYPTPTRWYAYMYFEQTGNTEHSHSPKVLIEYAMENKAMEEARK